MTKQVKFDLELIKEQRRTQPVYLTQFYRDWYAWATNPNRGQEFQANWGLCTNCYIGVRHHLKMQLTQAYGATWYPFGQDAYFNDEDNHTQYADPNRIEWVRLHIPELNT